MNTPWTLSIASLSLLAVGTLVACKGQNKAPPEPVIIEGWHQAEGWKGECFFPKDFEALGRGDRRMHRSEVLNAMMQQWKGEKGPDFGAETATTVETVLLGKPSMIENVSRDNLAYCKATMDGSGGSEAWRAWFEALPGKLTEGDCTSPPLRDQVFDYLDLGKGWQFYWGVCEGDRFYVKASEKDYYKITDDGPWVNAAGDPDKRAVGEEWPCTLEGCNEGTLVFRFVSDDNTTETILPAGTYMEFEAPAHGRIAVRFNDVDFYDNQWKQEGRMTHRTGVEYGPLDK